MPLTLWLATHRCATPFANVCAVRRISRALFPGWRSSAVVLAISRRCATGSPQHGTSALSCPRSIRCQRRSRASCRGFALSGTRFSPSSRALLADSLPLDRRDGGFIADGFDEDLDEARALRDESRRVIAELQASYCELAGTRQLRIKHNNMLGFFIETTQVQGERLRLPPLDATFLHRQTMVGAMRFSTRELVELEAKIASAADRALVPSSKATLIGSRTTSRRNARRSLRQPMRLLCSMPHARLPNWPCGIAGRGPPWTTHFPS